jgi:hypothetical protein
MEVELPKWVAVELACRIISRFDKRTSFNEFKNTKKLVRLLERYKSFDTSHAIAAQVFKKVTSLKLHEKTPYLRAFYFLNLHIRTGRQVIMPKDVFYGFVKYIGKSRFGGETIRYIEEFSPINKQRSFEGTGFIVYHRDCATKFMGKNQPVIGLSMGTFKFFFSTVEFKYIEGSPFNIKKSLGTYEVTEIGENLVLQIQIIKNEENELESKINANVITFTFYVDCETTYLALGMMKVGPITTKRVVIESEEIDELPQPWFCDNFSNLPSAFFSGIWNFLVENYTSVMELPRSITAEDDVHAYLISFATYKSKSNFRKIRLRHDPGLLIDNVVANNSSFSIQRWDFIIRDTILNHQSEFVEICGIGSFTILNNNGHTIAILQYYSQPDSYSLWEGDYQLLGNESEVIKGSFKSSENNSHIDLILYTKKKRFQFTCGEFIDYLNPHRNLYAVEGRLGDYEEDFFELRCVRTRTSLHHKRSAYQFQTFLEIGKSGNNGNLLIDEFYSDDPKGQIRV